MKKSMELNWWPESCDLPEETLSGARLRQLSSAPAITHNLYCEQPYCSADGNRLALFRTLEADPLVPGDLLIYDIETYRTARVSRQISGIGARIMAVANAAWSGVLFAGRGEGDNRTLMRFDMNTLECE